MQKNKNQGQITENLFIEMLIKRFGEKNIFWHKLTDLQSVIGGRPQLRKLGINTPNTPADFIVGVNGKLYFMEVKYCSNHIFNFKSRLTKSQLIAIQMLAIMGMGDTYHIYFYYGAENFWCWINADDIYNYLVKQNKKSISMLDLKRI